MGPGAEGPALTNLVVRLPFTRVAPPGGTAPAPPPKQPKLTIRSLAGGPDCRVPFAPQTGTLAGAAAVFTRQPRPGRVDAVIQTNAPTPTLPLDLTFRRPRGFEVNVESDLKPLRRMAEEAFPVILHGGSPSWAGPWFITDLSVETLDLQVGTNYIAAAVAHTTFTRAAADELNAFGPVTGGLKVPGRKQKPWRTYKVRKGDTLPGIAAKLLGDATLYGIIAALNRLRTTKLHVGQVLKLPDMPT